MEKIQILVHRSEASKLLERAQKKGVIHFTKLENTDGLLHGEKNVFEFNYHASRLDFAVKFLERFEKVGALKAIFEGRRVVTTQEEIEKVVHSFYFNDVITTTQNLEKKLNEIDARTNELREEQLLLEKWRNLDFPLNASLKTAHTETFPLTGTLLNIDTLTVALEETEFSYELTRTGEKTALLTLLHKDKHKVLDIVRTNKVDPTTLPKRRGTPLEEIERIDRRIIKLAKNKEVMLTQAQALVEYLPKIKMVADYMNWKKEKNDLLTQTYRTSEVMVFVGWCPKEAIDALRKDIEEHATLFSFEVIDAGDEEPPVELENRRLIKPFETITRLYGVPGYKDIDPTIFLAGFFFIFFGLCLTDVMYGIIMFVLIAFILMKYKIQKEMRMLLTLLMFGGLASAVIGLFFGGYFGIDMVLISEKIPFLGKIQLFDPIGNPLPIFYLSLVLGFIHVMFGVMLKIVREAKNNNLTGGLIDQVPWLMLFVTIALGVMDMINIITLPAHTVSVLAGISVMSIVLTQGRTQKGIFMKGLMGTLSLYGIIGYFSDTLSYSRLLALGLATSALAFSINMIALLVRDLVPVIGPIAMIIVLVIGHSFNLLVNTLGAFIHSARLQFVEFFGKFILGTGVEFKPFTQLQRNVILEK